MATKKNINEKTDRNNAKLNFFQKLFENFFNSSDPEAQKKRKLKNLGKTFNKSKFHSFYRPASDEAMPTLPKFMFDLAKVTFPAQITFAKIQNPNQYKHQVINYTLSQRQLDLLEHFDEDFIVKKVRETSIKTVTSVITKELDEFAASFDNALMSKAENLYKALVLFRDFCNFDYYAFLRKFSSAVKQNSFDVVPEFSKIDAGYILDNLMDFVMVAYPIVDDSVDWQSFFEMQKQIYGRELVASGTWKKIVSRISAIKNSGSFEMMIQLISKNPDYITDAHFSYESLIEPYLDNIQTETRSILSRISDGQKESKAHQLCSQIFGSTTVEAIHYYTSASNSVFEKKELGTYEYCDALNYLKSFLVEYVKRDIREFFDVVVIRGQWDASLSAPVSNAYQELLKVSEEITAFDDSLAEDGTLGVKIKTLLPKTAHDPGAENIINRVISDSNEQAKGFLHLCTQNLIVIARTIKILIEDYSKTKPTICRNWKELEKYIEKPMKDFCVDIYKKIYMFVQLMQIYLQN